MTGAARTLALCAIIAALVLTAAPAPASAGVRGTLCSVAGWLSTVAGKVCTVAADPGRVLDAGKKLAGGHVGGALGALTGTASKTVARTAGVVALAAGVISGAHLALKLTVNAIGGSTNPDLGSVWFSASYWRMAAVAALLTVPFLFAAAIQAMLHSDLTLLMRSAFGYLPLGLLAVGVAAPVTGLLLAGSDEMSAVVASASGRAGASFLGHVGALGVGISGLSGTAFLSFFIALFTIAAALTLWLELLIRQAAVYVIVLMLPLFFAAMVWPARRIWAVRAVELLVALILSKFAIVAVLGLGGAALGHALIPGIGSLLAGTTLVLLAAFSPWAMLRLLPLHELAGAAAGGLRPHGTQPPQVAGNRAEGLTDATEDAAGGAAGEQAAGRGDAPSEEVAAGLPAHLLAITRRDAMGEEAAARADDAGSPEEADGGGGSQGTAAADGSEASAGSREPAGAGARAMTTAGDVGAALSTPSSAPTAPESDAFGPRVHRGELPDEIRNLGASGDVLCLDQPRDAQTEPPPEPGPAVLPEPGSPAPLEPGPETDAE